MPEINLQVVLAISSPKDSIGLAITKRGILGVPTANSTGAVLIDSHEKESRREGKEGVCYWGLGFRVWGRDAVLGTQGNNCRTKL